MDCDVKTMNGYDFLKIHLFTFEVGSSKFVSRSTINSGVGRDFVFMAHCKFVN